jgi:lactam utilization protein B
MLINCDIGERGVGHAVDDVLMRMIDIANIACGGHAGDKESVNYYKSLASEHNVKITAHLSYPDVANFGRKVLDISESELLKSLDEQYALISDVQAVKFHGALYNEANINENLARTLLQWLEANEIKEILTPSNSLLSTLHSNVNIVHEAFLDRSYRIKDDTLQLSPRSLPNAVITDPKHALEQFEAIKSGRLLDQALKADTLCLHSDNTNAIAILKAIRGV